ncbi:hypothetical protein SAMN02745248_00608 [Hathewaya proteolytica DSM 3090]|uniref:Uncharacterized protein n=1 Tax=Hathewaya proteolytica DSM 3090 TaxID=1121331 RepID=A0A1M6L3J4_9CLOT|nr:hypothetical protein [Hathewaya proteolytica]SHJ65767.1 hypothetical protein SAMN02745248_00608 [Hathewaya proteolytica DSM 3090]
MTNTFNMPISDLIKYLHDTAEQDNTELYNADSTVKVLDNKNDKIITLSLVCNYNTYTQIYRYQFCKFLEFGYRFYKEDFMISKLELEVIMGGR